VTSKIEINYVGITTIISQVDFSLCWRADHSPLHPFDLWSCLPFPKNYSECKETVPFSRCHNSLRLHTKSVLHCKRNANPYIHVNGSLHSVDLWFLVLIRHRQLNEWFMHHSLLLYLDQCQGVPTKSLTQRFLCWAIKRLSACTRIPPCIREVNSVRGPLYLTPGCDR